MYWTAGSVSANILALYVDAQIIRGRRWRRWAAATEASVIFFDISDAIAPELDKRVLDETGGQYIEWLDYPFDRSRTWRDGEWKGLDFLDLDNPARMAWQKAWPQRGNPPNWDAIGRVTVDGIKEWLLVEAKANTEELHSSCQASEAGGRPLILQALTATQARLGVAAERDWLERYYQFANRVFVLDLLLGSKVPARLLNIYFTGDLGDERRSCPADIRGWDQALASLKAHIGLPRTHALEGRMHEIFLSVCPPAHAGA